MFNCGWDPSNAVNNNGKITLALNDTPGSGRPFSSGEYRTQGFYGYGTIEASIRAANGSGLITSLFTCTGPYDNGNPHDEIDWEIFGKDPRTAQTNYFTNGRGGHEQVIHLGFDASTGFHKYTIVWKPDEIDWLVDGKNVRTVQGSPETLPKTPGRVMANLWPGTGVDGWTGKFTYPGNPITAEYGWIRFIPQSGEAKTSAAAPASSGTNSAPNPAAATARGNLSGISIVTESTFNGATGGSE
jgi:beta-glucanase (GH16 family)